MSISARFAVRGVLIVSARMLDSSGMKLMYVACAGLLVGCGGGKVELDPVRETGDKVVVDPSIVRDKEDVSEEKTAGEDLRFVGLTKAAAKKLAESENQRSRVVREDGKARVLTQDYRPERLNFTVVDGRVTRVTRG